MELIVSSWQFAGILLIGILICLEVGRQIGLHVGRSESGPTIGVGAVEGAIFALYGLLLAFTFSGAPMRLDARRQLIADEANAIHTAYLRLDLLNAESQTTLRPLFRDYLDARVQVYSKLPDTVAAKEDLARSERLQKEIWERAVAGCVAPGANPSAPMLVLQSLNAMIDISTTRTVKSLIHPPFVIFALLFLLALVCSLIAGFGMAANKTRSWLHIISFSIVTVITVFTILEIEYPRIGVWTNESTFDQVLIDVRTNMQ